MRKHLIIHILFWISYIVIWSAHDLAYYPHYYKNIETNFYKFLPYIPVVYFNLLFLIPRFLLKRRIKRYIGCLGVGVVITAFFSSWSLTYFYYNIRNYIPRAEFYASIGGKFSMLTDVLLVVFFSMIIFLFNEWYQKDKYAKEIEQKQLEAELNLLKTQLNPHFLFNALNSIYVMLGKNLDMGKDMLIQFSDLLSHQLYDSQQEMVPLKKELNNLIKYINLERVRHEDLVKVNIKFPENINQLKIAPMLLLPIAENAFKHGQSSKGYWINIVAKIENKNVFNFEVENSYDKDNSDSSKKGIGLTNLRKRLELIYNKKHIIKTQRNPEAFKLNLQLELHEN